MIERFKKAKKIELSSLIPTENFRIVDIELRDMPCGITEIPVTIEFNKEYNPPYKNLMVGGLFIHGFVRMNDELAKLNEYEFRKGNSSDVIKRIYLTDWDGAFLLSLALNSGGEYKFAVTNEEVDSLVINCIHPNKKTILTGKEN
ncbi:MAG: hypothetical protein PQJ49_12340 [Sphaerochaetaceae bacterium]|nr:hypothetical protein [Sphaerochaetaceae bacterium]MDC7237630.1 hypothetical protein [Sphaerochaetaceae bacterium]MDC7242539.1 hypothetical protein [Sphaerochaetaceae bacterium]MDC7250698.1 hypothetical protein [Sphaerochaetaceae bacterium]